MIHFQEDLDNYKALALTAMKDAKYPIVLYEPSKEPYVTEAQKKQRKRIDAHHRNLEHIRIGSKR